MKTLVLLTALALAASAQGLIEADGSRWRHVAVGKPGGGRKFDLYVRLPFGETRQLPELSVRTHGGPVSVVKLDCKKGLVRAGDEEWVKAPAGSVGKALLKFACKK